MTFLSKIIQVDEVDILRTRSLMEWMCGGRKNSHLDFYFAFPFILIRISIRISIFIVDDLKMIARTEVRTKPLHWKLEMKSCWRVSNVKTFRK